MRQHLYKQLCLPSKQLYNFINLYLNQYEFELSIIRYVLTLHRLVLTFIAIIASVPE